MANPLNDSGTKAMDKLGRLSRNKLPIVHVFSTELHSLSSCHLGINTDEEFSYNSTHSPMIQCMVISLLLVVLPLFSVKSRRVWNKNFKWLSWIFSAQASLRSHVGGIPLQIAFMDADSS